MGKRVLYMRRVVLADSGDEIGFMARLDGTYIGFFPDFSSLREAFDSSVVDEIRCITAPVVI